MEHARHRLPGALRLESFPGHLDDELVAACRPLDSRDAPDVVLTLVFQSLENLELDGNLKPIIGVKPHFRHMDVAQFACDQVLQHRIHVLLVVVGNTPRSGPSALELAVLALLGHSSHQNVIAHREMWQRLAATAARNYQLLQPVFVEWAKTENPCRPPR